jgi:CBS domain-containing protein
MTHPDAPGIGGSDDPSAAEEAGEGDTDVVIDLPGIAQQLREGAESPRMSIRALLRTTLGAYRRGPDVVSRLRRLLSDAGLRTDPDFEIPFIGHEIRFVLDTPLADTPPHRPAAADTTDAPSGEGEGLTAPTSLAASLNEPTYRVHRLRTASVPPVWVTPGTTITAAATIMLARDFSQLPVGNSLRSIKGVVSWKSVGAKLVLGAPTSAADTVDKVLQPAAIIDATESLFAAIPLIAENQYVLVRGRDSAICGIITATDLTLQFQELTEPFLLIQEAELFLRNLLRERFTRDELQSARNPSDDARAIESVDDLSLGEIHRFLCRDEVFSRTALPVDRKVFTADLEGVVRIRNDVMHFDTDALGAEQLRTLREFVRFLQKLERIGALAAGSR